jgi:hypothetical protein
MLVHPKKISPLPAWQAADLIHELPHQKNAPAANPKLRRVQMRHGRQVKRFALVHETDFNAGRVKEALNLQRSIRTVSVSMANDIAGGLTASQDHGMDGRRIKTTHQADAFNKTANDGHHARIAGNG